VLRKRVAFFLLFPTFTTDRLPEVHMAPRRGIKEKVHIPIYDSIKVEPGKLLRVQAESAFKFFVQTKGKSKLETNVWLLSQFGRFEASSMRVVIAPQDPASRIAKLAYNTITALIVRERIMIELPTWFFVGDGALGPLAAMTRRGDWSTAAGFRFAEPIVIDKQQNFRAEMAVPRADSVKALPRIPAPLLVWVVLDGYFTRET